MPAAVLEQAPLPLNTPDSGTNPSLPPYPEMVPTPDTTALHDLLRTMALADPHRSLNAQIQHDQKGMERGLQKAMRTATITTGESLQGAYDIANYIWFGNANDALPPGLTMLDSGRPGIGPHIILDPTFWGTSPAAVLTGVPEIRDIQERRLAELSNKGVDIDKAVQDIIVRTPAYQLLKDLGTPPPTITEEQPLPRPTRDLLEAMGHKAIQDKLSSVSAHVGATTAMRTVGKPQVRRLNAGLELATEQQPATPESPMQRAARFFRETAATVARLKEPVISAEVVPHTYGYRGQGMVQLNGGEKRVATATIAEALRRTGRLASTDTTAGNDISDQLLEEVITWVFEATNPNTPNPSRQTYETLLQAEVYRLAKALSDDLIKTATCQLMDTTALNLLKRPATDSEARKPALPEHTALKGDAALNAEMAEKLRKIHIGEVVYARQPDGVQRIVRYTQGEQLGGLNGRRPDLALRLDQPSWLTPHLTGYTTIAYNPKRKIYYFQRAEVDPHRHCDTPLPEDALPRLAANLAAQGFTALSSKLAESDTMTVGELERLIKTENTYWIPSETIVLSNSNYGLARFQQFAENGRIGGWCTVHSELLTSLLRSAFGAENNPHINIRTIGGPVVMTDTKIVDALEHAEVEFTDPVTGETYLLNPTPASGQPDSSKPVGVRGGASVIRSLRENGREFAATQAQRIKRIGAWAARLATSRKPKEKEDAPLTVAALERMAATAGEPEAVTAEEKVRIVERQLIRQLRTIWGYGIQAKDDEYVRDRIFSRLNSLPPFDPLLRTARLIQQAQPAGNLPARTDTVGIEQDIRLIEQDLAMLRRLERARTDPDTAAELDIDPRLLMRQGKTYFTNPAMIDLVDGTLRQLRSALGLKALPQSRRR